MTTLEDSLVVSYKTKHSLTIKSRIHTPWYLSKGVENRFTHTHTNLYMNVDSSFHHYQNLKASKMSSVGE